MKTLTQRLLANLNLANQLTFLRLVTVPFFVIVVLQARFGLALGLFVAAALTDLLDGLSARLLKQQTPLGTLLDPAADKLLLTAGFILLTEYPTMFQEIPMVARIPIWLTVLTIFRDIFIVGVVLILYLALGQSHFKPSMWGKLTTTVEFLTVSLFLLANSLGRAVEALGVMVWVTLALTLISGFHYMARTIRMLRSSNGAGPDLR